MCSRLLCGPAVAQPLPHARQPFRTAGLLDPQQNAHIPGWLKTSRRPELGADPAGTQKRRPASRPFPRTALLFQAGNDGGILQQVIRRPGQEMPQQPGLAGAPWAGQHHGWETPRRTEHLRFQLPRHVTRQ